MANTERRKSYTDKNGNMFMPMNVEGGYWNEHFITTPKFICIVLMLLSFVGIILILGSDDVAAGPMQYIIYLGIWLIVCANITRFFIFEEKFYYRMYKEMQKYEVTTPSVFWEIASIKDTDDGGIITYSDTRIGIIVKLERDTITGKSSDFKETHYDAISEFYRSVLTDRYNFIQMNIMEQAGKDPRLNELSKLVTKSDNPNISKLMEMEIGHIKNMTNTTLYESDYFLFYTADTSKLDVIIEEIYESLFKLLDGAYIGFQILSSKEIVEVVKDMYGVNYFNATQASLMMFEGADALQPITITGLNWADGNTQILSVGDRNKLRQITSGVIRGTVQSDKMALKNAVYKENKENKFGISFEELSEADGVPDNRQDNMVTIHKGKEGSTIRKGTNILRKKTNVIQQSNSTDLPIGEKPLGQTSETPIGDDDEIIDF